MSRFTSARLRKDLFTAVAFAVPVIVSVTPRTAHADEPAPTAPAAPATIGPPPPTVELSADDGRATIERRVGTASPGGLPLLETGLFTVGQWEHQCIAPCSVKLDPKYAYRVSGDGLVPTDSFSLPRNADKIRVDAKMGSSTGRVAGAIATAGGAGLMALGTLALILTPIFESEDVGSKGFRSGLTVGGVSALSVGAVAVGTGLYLWFTNGSHARTEVASR